MKKLVLLLVLVATISTVFGCGKEQDSPEQSYFSSSMRNSLLSQNEISQQEDSSSSTQMKLPSDILDLTNWKITLPIASEKGTAMEVKQPELGIYSHEKYFKVNAQGDGVVFSAPVEGVTTSGSNYPRSELREMTNGGTQRASWSTDSGTHIMRITQSITHLPEVKKHVVVGQIHDGKSDVIVFRLENKKLFIDLNGSDGPVLNGNYVLGTKFTVQFVAGAGGVMCYYNGKYIYTYTISTSECYFKAGIYTQSNLSKDDSIGAYGECVIYDLSVSHVDHSPSAPTEYEW